MKAEKIFRVVSVDERLPKKMETVKVNNGRELAYIDESGKWVCTKQYLEIYNWLEEREGVIVFTPEELKSLILDWNYGHEKGGINEFLKEKGLL